MLMLPLLGSGREVAQRESSEIVEMVGTQIAKSVCKVHVFRYQFLPVNKFRFIAVLRFCRWTFVLRAAYIYTPEHISVFSEGFANIFIQQ